MKSPQGRRLQLRDVLYARWMVSRRSTVRGSGLQLTRDWPFEEALRTQASNHIPFDYEALLLRPGTASHAFGPALPT